ncbi:MAG TPA: GTP cyclohydrolase II [Acidobacteriaceae bacterium]|nr:GTP cyclohydrolase II [Acidobacteriaceae bacterium]
MITPVEATLGDGKKLRSKSALACLVASCKLHTPWAEFDLHGFEEIGSDREHVALTIGRVNDGAPALVRMHSECLTGDVLFSQRCDCGAQLEAALGTIAQEGRGALIYLRQEGRGIGLLNKIKAYRLQDAGADTVEANHRLGFAADMRDYAIGAAILGELGIRSVRLMTNNPRKVVALEHHGVSVTERLPLLVGWNEHNSRYLKAKATRLGHLLWKD